MIVVEDELPMRQELARFDWASLDCEFVGEAANGAEGLALYQRVKPDIVFADITMPLVDGLALAREIIAQDEGCRVVLITCHRDFDYAQEAIRIGVTDYLVKTDFSAEQLRRVINKLRMGQHRNETDYNGLRYELREALAIIEREYAQPLTLSEVARRVGLSTPYLCRLFSEKFNESFLEYLTRIRIRNAVKLINETNLRVYEIAERVGIPNYRYFSTIFKKVTGKAPSEMRQ